MRQQGGGWGGEKGGEMTVDAPGQHVLERTSALLAGGGDLEARFTVALPAKGRTVLGAWAAAIFVTNLPRSGPGLRPCRQQMRRLLCDRCRWCLWPGTRWFHPCLHVCQEACAARCGHGLQL